MRSTLMWAVVLIGLIEDPPQRTDALVLDVARMKSEATFVGEPLQLVARLTNQEAIDERRARWAEAGGGGCPPRDFVPSRTLRFPRRRGGWVHGVVARVAQVLPEGGEVEVLDATVMEAQFLEAIPSSGPFYVELGMHTSIARVELPPSLTVDLGQGDYVLRLRYDSGSVRCAGADDISDLRTDEVVVPFSLRYPGGPADERAVLYTRARYHHLRGDRELAHSLAQALITDDPEYTHSLGGAMTLAAHAAMACGRHAAAASALQAILDRGTHGQDEEASIRARIEELLATPDGDPVPTQWASCGTTGPQDRTNGGSGSRR